MRPIEIRVAALEAARKSDAGHRTYVVEWLAGESPEQAIARESPMRPFFIVPMPCASMDAWTREAMECLAMPGFPRDNIHSQNNTGSAIS